MAQRLFTRKKVNDQVVHFNRAEMGKDRMQIYLGENNSPQFEILAKKEKVKEELIKK